MCLESRGRTFPLCLRRLVCGHARRPRQPVAWRRGLSPVTPGSGQGHGTRPRPFGGPCPSPEGHGHDEASCLEAASSQGQSLQEGFHRQPNDEPLCLPAQAGRVRASVRRSRVKCGFHRILPDCCVVLPVPPRPVPASGREWEGGGQVPGGPGRPPSLGLDSGRD